MGLNAVVNRVRRLFRLPYWSLVGLSQEPRQEGRRVHLALRGGGGARGAGKRDCEGVICGHIHTPDDRMIDGIHYLNDGDWVESCTALVEHVDGAIRDHRLECCKALSLQPQEVPMRILIATDAWSPQVNGVVRTLNASSPSCGSDGPSTSRPDIRKAGEAWPMPLLPEIAPDRA